MANIPRRIALVMKDFTEKRGPDEARQMVNTKSHLPLFGPSLLAKDGEKASYPRKTG